jgi:uncharacterized protein
MNMLEKSWWTIEKEPVSDVLTVFKSLVSGGTRDVHIGTDSQQAGKFTEFVTVIVVLEPGKGGRAFYSRERTSRVKSLRERLMREVMLSVGLGLELNGSIPGSSNLTIHIDANPNVTFRSSDYIKELTSMVVGQGFKAVLKPDAWCASHVADHTVKTKVLG